MMQVRCAFQVQHIMVTDTAPQYRYYDGILDEEMSVHTS